MADVACAASFDVLGDAKEYQEWLQQQSPPEPAPVERKEPLAMSTEDLPPDVAQIVRLMEQEHAAVVLEAYQKLQEARYSEQKKLWYCSLSCAASNCPWLQVRVP